MFSEESRNKIRQRMIGHTVSQETRDKISRTKKAQGLTGDKCPMTGQKMSSERIAKGIETRLKNMKEKGGLKKASQERKDKIGAKAKERWANPEFKRKMSESIKGSGAGLKKGTKLSPEWVENIRKSRIKDWKDNPEYREKMIKAWIGIRTPNKGEIKLQEILNKNFNNEWKFVGNGEFIIGGICPDYVNVNGKKLVIELFGEYWHSPRNPKYKPIYGEELRSKILGRFGYKMLVVWYNDLKNEEKLVIKISDWIKSTQNGEHSHA